MAKRSAAVMVDEPTLGVDTSSNPASWLAYNTPSWITEAQAADPAPAAQPSLAVASAAPDVAPAAPDVAPAAPSLAVEPLRNYWGGIVEDTSPTRNFVTNKGNEAGSVTADPNSTYRILNNAAGGAEVYQGKGLEGLNNTYEIASDLSKHAGKTAGWSVQVQDPSTGEWSTVAQDDPAKPGFLGKAAMALGPIAGTALGFALAPLTGGMSVPLMMALGAGAGTMGGNLAAGNGLADSFLKGGIGGMTSLATAGLTGGLGAGAPLGQLAVTDPILASAIAGGGLEAAKGALEGHGIGEIAKDTAIAGAGSAAGAYLGPKMPQFGTADGSAVGGVDGGDGGGSVGGTSDNITVTARPGAGSGFGSAVGSGLTDIFKANDQAADQPDGNGITVTGARPTPPSFLVPPSLAVDTGADAPQTTDDNNEIEVTGKKEDPITLTIPPLNLPDMTPKIDLPSLSDTPAATEEKKGLSYDQIMKLLGLVASGAGLLGNAVGGKGKSSQGTVPAGFGTGPANIPGFGGSLNDAIAALPAGTARQPRVMPQQDWQRYATRPEQSFFTNIPQTYTPPLPGEEDQWTGRSRGYARGGGVEGQSLAVRGPGTDRSDSIPAYLSDGEYVIDAPTVRKIGRGSTERGFDRLDDLRVTVHGGKPHRALKSVGAR